MKFTFQFEANDDETDEGLQESQQLVSLPFRVGLSGRPAEPLTQIEESSKENILRELRKAKAEQRCKVYQLSIILN